jgi:hypothetical protein
MLPIHVQGLRGDFGGVPIARAEYRSLLSPEKLVVTYPLASQLQRTLFTRLWNRNLTRKDGDDDADKILFNIILQPVVQFPKQLLSRFRANILAYVS